MCKDETCCTGTTSAVGRACELEGLLIHVLDIASAGNTCTAASRGTLVPTDTLEAKYNTCCSKNPSATSATIATQRYTQRSYLAQVTNRAPNTHLQHHVHNPDHVSHGCMLRHVYHVQLLQHKDNVQNHSSTTNYLVPTISTLST